VKNAHAQTVLLSNDIQEVTPCHSGSRNTRVLAGESLLSLYKNSYTVNYYLVSTILLGKLGQYGIREEIGVVSWISKWQKTEGLHRRGKEQLD